VHVETSNAESGIWYFRPQPDGPVEQVPFLRVPSRALVDLNASFRLGPATLFGRVENVFGRRYAGNVVANEGSGRFYEPGSSASASFGIGLAGFGAPPDASR